MNKPRKYLIRYRNTGNFMIAVQSLMIVAAVLAVLFFGIEYKLISPPKKVQRSVLTRINLNANNKFFQQIELRDPGKIFENGNNGFSVFKPAYKVEKIFSLRPETPQSSAAVSGKFSAVKENPFPPSPRYAEFTGKKILPVKKVSAIITPEGKIIHLDLLEDIKLDKNPQKNTVLKLYRSGSIQRCRVIVSCGNISADKSAVKAVLKLGANCGSYTVIWNENGNLKI